MEAASSEQQTRVFRISPKTPYDYEQNPHRKPCLKDANFRFGGGARLMVARDMVENVRELTGNNMIDAAIPHFLVQISANNHYGVDALDNSVASPLGSALRLLNLGMSSPEGVYMSGYSIYWALGKSLGKANERVKGIESGQIKFITSEARENDLQKNRNAGGLLGKFEKTLSVSLKEYADQYLPNPKYREILQSLAFIGGSQSCRLIEGKARSRIVKLLKKDEIDQAYEVFRAIPRTDVRI